MYIYIRKNYAALKKKEIMYVISSGSLCSAFYFKQTTKIEKAKNEINFTQSSSPLSPADSHLKLRSLKNQGKEINEKKGRKD